MLPPTSPPWLRLLCNLRWLGIAGQAITVAVVTGPVGVSLPVAPLWAGIGTLTLFNVYVTWRSRAREEARQAEVFAHLLVDILVLAWMVGWSGGVENPFSSLFLLPMALSVLALGGGWIWATAAASVLGFAVSALAARPLPHVHGVFGDVFSLHKLGMLANFLVSAVVILVFFTRMARARRESEREVERLRERFARNEGIVALATHAASVAHELNTPLGTLTLMVEDMADDAANDARRGDFDIMRKLLESCRDCVRELSRPADSDAGKSTGADVEGIVERWRLVRPTVDLQRTGSNLAGRTVDPAVGHLMQALLNNAADASQQAGTTRVDLHIEISEKEIRASIRDYGPGIEHIQPLLPGKLFRTNKPGGMGVGLALSHATVESLGGTLSMQAAMEGPGLVVSFNLPVTGGK